MRKNFIFKIILITILCLGLLSSCGLKAENSSRNSAGTSNNDSTEKNVKETDSANSSTTRKPVIVCTIFPEYDWVLNILGEDIDKFDVKLLLDKGTDLHSYQPTADDLLMISSCDFFIYVGGESDKWVEDALKEAVNKNMKVINLSDTLKNSLKEEEIIEGMEREDENEDDDEEGPEYDEHVWLSLKNAKIITAEISEVLKKLNPDSTNLYKSNTTAYIEKLNTLDKEYSDTVKNSSKNTLLFADRFPFRYMVEDYNLKYYAAFLGCSAESEASFDTISFLASKVDELKLNNVLVIENSNQEIAKTVINNAKDKNIQIRVLNSMQSVTAEDVANGTNYLGIMKDNLKVLNEVLK